MENFHDFYDTGNLVNYTNVLTSAANEIYVCSTDAPDSKAFLIKNRVFINFSLSPTLDDKMPAKGDQSTRLASPFRHGVTNTF